MALLDESESGEAHRIPPLLFACMICGQLAPVRADLSLFETGWQYDEVHGWLCKRCDERDLGPRHRGPGHPMRGNS